jgi:hypothetical protein
LSGSLLRSDPSEGGEYCTDAGNVRSCANLAFLSGLAGANTNMVPVRLRQEIATVYSVSHWAQKLPGHYANPPRDTAGTRYA